MKVRNCFTLLITTVLLSACVNKDGFYIHEENKGGEDYAKLFSNTSSINIDIESSSVNAFYSIYFEYPYNDEGDLTASCCLQGTTPIHTSLSVPKDVTTIYVLGNGEIKELPVSDVSINDNSAKKVSRSRSEQTFTQDVLGLIDTKYFPERSNNVRNDDLYKCTDILVDQASSTKEFDEADIWLTYISDGGFSKSNMYGKMWFYTYPSSKYKTITLSDCKFYGVDENDGIVEVPYNDILNSNSDIESNNPVFWSKKENAKVVKGNHTRVNLGRFPKGVNVGFVFKGSKERPQFTTPALNASTDTHNYINSIVTYRDGSGSYQIKEPVGNGFICHIKTDDFEGNVLGMENRTPNHVSYDGDYNDMLCLIETNPVDLKTVEEITIDSIGSFTKTSGILLFEDNYPFKGDFDFNDVVIKYTIIDYFKTTDYRKDITTSILASGCSYANEFGYYNGKEYISIFTGIEGFTNVWNPNIDLNKIESKTITVHGKTIKPYLNNGKGYIMDATYNTSEFPYVLDIPITDDNTMFHWCLEGKSIEDAYKFKAPRSKDWYLTPKDENLVVKH